MTDRTWIVLGCLAVGFILLGVAAVAAGILRRDRTAPGLPDDGEGCMSVKEEVSFGLIVLLQDETAPEPERSA